MWSRHLSFTKTSIITDFFLVKKTRLSQSKQNGKEFPSDDSLDCTSNLWQVATSLPSPSYGGDSGVDPSFQ